MLLFNLHMAYSGIAPNIFPHLLQSESNHFLELFYDKYIAQLIAVLSDACEPGRQAAAPGAAPSALALIVDLLCFCVQQHSYRIKCATPSHAKHSRHGTRLMAIINANTITLAKGNPCHWHGAEVRHANPEVLFALDSAQCCVCPVVSLRGLS